MLSKHLLPKFIKEVIHHIPTLALKSVDWKSTLKELGPLVFKLGNSHLDQEKLNLIQNLGIQGLTLTNSSEANKSANVSKKAQGEKILEIYFSQLKIEEGLNLDLRSKYFGIQDTQIYWTPNNAWFQFDNNFRLALIELYQGFYFDKEELFKAALDKIGLTSELNEKDSKQLSKLFHNHFGTGDQTTVKFEMEKFQESFYELFKFFMEKEVKLSKDFIFLGIYLVTLYLHLEELDEEFNVRQAFLNAFKAN